MLLQKLQRLLQSTKTVPHVNASAIGSSPAGQSHNGKLPVHHVLFVSGCPDFHEIARGGFPFPSRNPMVLFLMVVKSRTGSWQSIMRR